MKYLYGCILALVFSFESKASSSNKLLYDLMRAKSARSLHRDSQAPLSLSSSHAPKNQGPFVFFFTSAYGYLSYEISKRFLKEKPSSSPKKDSPLNEKDWELIYLVGSGG